MIHGVINLNKPKGITSHDAVSRLRRILQQRRIGHTGTLDPLAQGVLPICLGDATRIAEYLSGADKTYRVWMRFGYSSDTLDITGQVKEVESVEISSRDLDKILQNFQGEIEQVPPMYSAISIKGQRLHQLARQGKTIDRPARRVIIHKIEHLNSFKGPLGFEAELRVKCSKGTYIRSLVQDIGKAAGTDAILTDLTREKSGGFSLDQALDFASIEARVESAQTAEILHLLSPKQLSLPIRTLTPEEKNEIKFGRFINCSLDEKEILAQEDLLLLYQEKLVAIGTLVDQDGSCLIKPKKNFVNPLKFVKK